MKRQWFISMTVYLFVVTLEYCLYSFILVRLLQNGFNLFALFLITKYIVYPLYSLDGKLLPTIWTNTPPLELEEMQKMSSTKPRTYRDLVHTKLATESASQQHFSAVLLPTLCHLGPTKQSDLDCWLSNWKIVSKLQMVYVVNSFLNHKLMDKSCFGLIDEPPVLFCHRSSAEGWDQQKSLWEVQEGTQLSPAHYRQRCAFREIRWWVRTDGGSSHWARPPQETQMPR